MNERGRATPWHPGTDGQSVMNTCMTSLINRWMEKWIKSLMNGQNENADKRRIKWWLPTLWMILPSLVCAHSCGPPMPRQLPIVTSSSLRGNGAVTY